MELVGEVRIPAPRARVWTLLNDPAVLAACIPGCESLSGSPEDGFTARVTTRIGPVKATFEGAVTLTELDPPNGYRIAGEGRGGVAGFAKGGADVRLAADSDVTVLTYAAKAQVGGKLAQLGSRLVDSTARKLADEFFTCFARKAGEDAGTTSVSVAPPGDGTVAAEAPVEAIPPMPGAAAVPPPRPAATAPALQPAPARFPGWAIAAAVIVVAGAALALVF